MEGRWQLFMCSVKTPSPTSIAPEVFAITTSSTLRPYPFVDDDT